jgi:alkylation response protein AidB-like acyl-CoA dehydrogenase
MEELRQEVADWLATNWSGERSPDFLEKVVDAKWAAPSWPVEWFGRGLTPEVAQVVAQEFDKVGAPGAGQDVTNLWANTVLAFGSDELRQEHLRDLMLGRTNMCLLYSEPGAGSDLASVQTRADRDGDEWIVNGQKVWTSSGRNADFAFLIARTDWDVPKHRGLSFFFLPMKQDGVEVRALRQATGDSRFNEVFLTDARVSNANMLGDLGKGWSTLQTALAYERAVMGESASRRKKDSDNEAVRSADDEAHAPVPDLSLVDLARDMGKLDDPTTRQQLMALRSLVLVNRWNGQRAKAELEQGTSSSIVSLGKLAMSRILHTAGSLQAEILGAEALLAGEDSPRAADATYAMLNAFFTSIGGGTDQIQRNIIGERVLGLPREPEVDKGLPFSQVRKATVA